jgi:hypothetical protein
MHSVITAIGLGDEAAQALRRHTLKQEIWFS